MMNLTRRQLLQLASASAISQYTLAGPQSTQHSSKAMVDRKSKQNDDYKAIVCLFLLGGNDSWNLLIPTADEQTAGAGYGYQTYQQRRAELAVARTELDLPMHQGKLQIGSAESNPYYGANNEQSYLKGVYPIANHQWGINGCAPELAELWHNKRLAWVVNTGVLAQPVTRETLKSAKLPLFLYAHNHQQKELAIAHALQKTRTGWAGRLADVWQVGQPQGINQGHLFGLNIAVGGNTPIITSQNAPELVLPYGKPQIIKGTVGKQKQAQALKTTWQALADAGRRDLWTHLYADQQNTAFALSTTLSELWASTTDYSKITGSYGEALFKTPDSGLIGLEGKGNKQLAKKLETVARLIEIGKQEGLKRQVFVVTMGGYDTHQGQTDKHPQLLRELSIGLGQFQQAMQTQNIEDQVTLFTQSDFGRTLSPNSTGTDHAWAGNQLVMGGAIKQSINGTMPDLSDNSQHMADDRRGRIIPTIAAEQTTATIARWFGVKEQHLPALFPMLTASTGTDNVAETLLSLFETKITN